MRTNIQEQSYFDEIKWQDSQALGKDTCGNYDRCKYCNKKDTYPCASAKNREMRSKRKKAQ